MHGGHIDPGCIDTLSLHCHANVGYLELLPLTNYLALAWPWLSLD